MPSKVPDITASRAAAVTAARPAKRDWTEFKVFTGRMLALLIPLVVWELLVRQGVLDVFFFGQPSVILSRTYKYILDGSLLLHTSVTVSETIIGFVAGMLIGSALGLLMWFSRTAARIVEPFLVVFNATPKIALAPMLVLYLGITYWMKVALSFSVVVVIAWMVAYEGARAVDADLVRLLHSLSATRWQVFTKVVIPSCLSWIISSFRLCIGFSLTGAVVGEFISAREGLGWFINFSSSVYELNDVWIGLLSLMLLASVLNVVVDWLERRLLAWRQAR